MFRFFRTSLVAATAALLVVLSARDASAQACTAAIGDLVWFRHAKSGELFEHTNDVHLLEGDAFVDRVPTYRGHGLAF